MFSKDTKTPDKTSPALKVPALANVSPRYQSLVERKAALTRRLGELEKQLREESVKATQSRKDRQERIAELLDPNSVIAAAPGQVQVVPSANATYLQTLHDEVTTTKQALTQIDDLINGERLVASAIICETMAPEHKRRVRAIVSAMVSLVEACGDYRAFMDAMNGENIAWASLRPMLPMWFADRADSYFREAVTYEFVTADELPKVRGDLSR